MYSMDVGLKERSRAWLLATCKLQGPSRRGAHDSWHHARDGAHVSLMLLSRVILLHVFLGQ